MQMHRFKSNCAVNVQTVCSHTAAGMQSRCSQFFFVAIGCWGVSQQFVASTAGTFVS
jgi:hypothetical protein